MANKFKDTVTELQALVAQGHRRVAVAFSGGKDSMATLDLALHAFPEVVAYFMYLVPGLEVDRQRIAIASERFNVPTYLYPHPAGWEAWRSTTYCDPLPEFDAFPDMSARAFYDWVKDDTKATLVLTGEKKADGFFRRRRIAVRKSNLADVVLPLKEWTRWEVLSYCKARELPVNAGGDADNSSVNLSIKEVLFLFDNHRADYERLRDFFPYIEAIVLRREWFERTDG